MGVCDSQTEREHSQRIPDQIEDIDLTEYEDLPKMTLLYDDKIETRFDIHQTLGTINTNQTRF